MKKTYRTRGVKLSGISVAACFLAYIAISHYICPVVLYGQIVVDVDIPVSDETMEPYAEDDLNSTAQTGNAAVDTAPQPAPVQPYIEPSLCKPADQNRFFEFPNTPSILQPRTPSASYPVDNSSADTDVIPLPGTEAGAETDSGTGTEFGTETEAGAETDSGTGTEAGTETESGAGTEAGAETDSGTGTESGAGTEFGTGTESGFEFNASSESGGQSNQIAIKVPSFSLRFPLPRGRILVSVPRALGPIPPDYLVGVSTRHPWGRFSEGAWKRLRVVNQSYNYDVAGNQTSTNSIADYRLTLSQAQPVQYKLVWESCLNVHIKSLNATPKIALCNYWDEPIDSQVVEFKTETNTSLNLSGVEYPCTWERVVFQSDTRRVEIETWRTVCSGCLPSIVRRTKKTFRIPTEKMADKASEKDKAADQELISEAEYLVSPTPTPYLLLGQVHQVYRANQWERSPSGQSESTSLVSLSVPGEIVSYETIFQDNRGVLLAKTTGSLIDYGFVSLEQPWNELRKTMINIGNFWHRPY